ncbi:MerR family transcriptional regulator [Streptomyces sp. NPDC088116]|uniref:DNA polymerase III subunit beta family protein n=1 Tax=Streptomyces sp. NPDC088116 TaxID=3365825 RepID=UPI0038133881
MDGITLSATQGLTKLLSIGDFARRVGLASSALRFYDDCGVLPPARVDEATGYRYYNPDQTTRAGLLRSLRAAGLTLADVTTVLDGDEEEARTVLERHRSAVREQQRAADATIAAVLGSLSPSGPYTGRRPDSGADAGTAFPGADTPATRVRLGGAELASALRQVVPAVGQDAEHPVLGCVLIEIGDGEIRLVATDRYRMSMRVLRPVVAVEGPDRHLLVEADALTEVGAWAARCVAVTIEAGPAGARVLDAGGSGARDLPSAEGRFPAYREMLSAAAEPRHRLIVDRSALLDAVDSRAGMSGDAPHGIPAIALRLGEDKVTVSLPDDSNSELLHATCLGDLPVRIGFDPAVLAPALEASVGPDVLLEIAAVDEPVVVRSADQGSFSTLVMPVGLAAPGS